MTRLRTLRTRAGLSQTEVAQKVGVDQTTISRLELGQIADPSHRTVQRLCRLLGVEWTIVREFQINGAE